MLRQRIITAIILTALLLGSLFSGKQILFSMLLGAFVCLAAWEWAGLVNCRSVQQKVFYAFMVILPLPFLHFFVMTPWVSAIALFGAAAWCVAAILVFSYQAGGSFVPAGHFIGYMTGFFVLVPAWTGLMWLTVQREGLQLILLFFVTISLADSAAFIAGQRWGKNRLASRISPGKTREGFYAGVLVAALPALTFVIYDGYTVNSGMGLIALCVVCTFFSVIGDLFISMFKRHAKVKDSGNILPGHGGVLDRIDSISAAAPVFATGIWMLEGRV